MDSYTKNLPNSEDSVMKGRKSMLDGKSLNIKIEQSYLDEIHKIGEGGNVKGVRLLVDFFKEMGGHNWLTEKMKNEMLLKRENDKKKKKTKQEKERNEKEIRKKIKSLREKGMSLKEIASAIGVTNSMYVQRRL